MKRSNQSVFLLLLLLFVYLAGNAQNKVDTLSSKDTVLISSKDTSLIKMSDNAITDIVKYKAQDSIVFNMQTKIIYMYEKSDVDYQDLSLDAAYIHIDFDKNLLHAIGKSDSLLADKERPHFMQNETQFLAEELTYNFKTRKGKIKTVVTQEGDGYIHGEIVKKINDDVSFIKRGSYTTCDKVSCPHFEIAFSKAKIIVDKSIFTGPAYFKFEGIPTPIAIPFGYFPLQKGRKNGILLPTVGESTRGFYLENIGYYFGINDNFDLSLLFDIYSRGSFGIKTKFNYVKRYKYNGHFEGGYARNIYGSKNTLDYRVSNDYQIKWSHQQDAKAHPNFKFSADVNIMSSNYNLYNNTTITDYLSNEFLSSLSMAYTIGSIGSLNLNVRYSQNTGTQTVDLSLPDLSFAINRFYPFRNKKIRKMKWYEDIAVNYQFQVLNKIQSVDSLFFTPSTWDNMQTGIKHYLPISIPVKIAKYLNWNNSINFTERWYLKAIQQNYADSLSGETPVSYITKDTLNHFYALHELNLSTNLTTVAYFTYQFKKGALKAIRHELTPSLQFTYSPNLNKKSVGIYYDSIQQKNVSYSYFENAILGIPSTQTQAILNFSLSNRLEIKVASKKDTITGTKKVVIFENVSLTTAYDFAKDSLRWIPLVISGRTTLLKTLYLSFNIVFDPYALNAYGSRYNTLEVKQNKRLMRFSTSDLNISLTLPIGELVRKIMGKNQEKSKSGKDGVTPMNTQTTLGTPQGKVDFKSPWNLNLSYTLAYSVRDEPLYYQYLSSKKYTQDVVQTLNIAGDFNITKKWKIGFTTGYDFVQKGISFTSIDVYRDLHCWEMRFNWIPFGTRKGWNFTINIKASVLQDVKFTKKKDFRDQYQ